MRVLLLASPLPGHVLPLVPLAAALADAGHDVVLATAAGGARVVPPALPSADVAPGLRIMPRMLRYVLRHPGMARRSAAGTEEVRGVGVLWAPINRAMAPGVEALADRIAPDLVVVEPFAVPGACAALRRGLPYVVVDNSLFDAEQLLASAAAAYGAAPLRPPAEFLATAPPSLVGARRGAPMRFVPPTGGEAPPELTAPGPRPRVLVSRSTVQQPGGDPLMRTVVERAAGADLELVLVRPDRRGTRRGLPDGVRTADWLPFPAVLPAAAGIVHHGGAGTLLTALACGTPQLVFPGAGDRRTNARLLAARGAGLAVELTDLDAAALRRLATDPDVRAAAGEVAAEMAAMPHPRDLVAPLEALSRAAAPAAAAAPRPERARTR